MLGSYQAEFVIGLAILGVAALLWRYLLSAFRRVPVPYLLRSNMAAELSTVFEIALLAFGVAALIDATVKAIP
jgi:hypothetical protein